MMLFLVQLFASPKKKQPLILSISKMMERKGKQYFSRCCASNVSGV